MSKPFKTIDEQIELLRYRGMTIADDEVARHALETLGYYRLSGYWYSFREHAGYRRKRGALDGVSWV